MYVYVCVYVYVYIPYPPKVDPACCKKHLPNESGSTATSWLQDPLHIVTIGLNEAGVVEVFAISAPVLAGVSIPIIILLSIYLNLPVVGSKMLKPLMVANGLAIP